MYVVMSNEIVHCFLSLLFLSFPMYVMMTKKYSYSNAKELITPRRGSAAVFPQLPFINSNLQRVKQTYHMY